MHLVEQHIIKSKHKFYKELNHLCFLSKNLYNVGLYEIRQHFFNTKDDPTIKYKYLNYFSLDKKLKTNKNKDYYALPSQTSQQTLKVLDQNFKSFFNLLKSKKANKHKDKINIPNYLNKTGRYLTKYSAQNISPNYLKQGIIKIPKTNIEFKTKISNIKNCIKEIRLVPKSNYILVEIVYSVTEPKLLENNNRYLAIDLGINNLMTCTSNIANSFIINGKPAKSINQYYNKTKAKLQSKLPNNTFISKKLNKLSLKRSNKIKNYFHKATKYIINQAVDQSINTIILGYNKGWKQEVNLGSKTNQNFTNIPFYLLLNMLSYKAKLKGINLFIQEESYTSKCSALDNECIKKHDTYLGQRVKRGLFKTKNGLLVNADVNGSLNIMRKNVTSNESLIPTCRGFVLNPLKISL